MSDKLSDERLKEIRERNDREILLEKVAYGAVTQNAADIADLLAEVERLRGGIKDILEANIDDINTILDSGMICDDLLDLLPEDEAQKIRDKAEED